MPVLSTLGKDTRLDRISNVLNRVIPIIVHRIYPLFELLGKRDDEGLNLPSLLEKGKGGKVSRKGLGKGFGERRRNVP